MYMCCAVAISCFLFWHKDTGVSRIRSSLFSWRREAWSWTWEGVSAQGTDGNLFGVLIRKGKKKSWVRALGVSDCHKEETNKKFLQLTPLLVSYALYCTVIWVDRIDMD